MELCTNRFRNGREKLLQTDRHFRIYISRDAIFNTIIGQFFFKWLMTHYFVKIFVIFDVYLGRKPYEPSYCHHIN